MKNIRIQELERELNAKEKQFELCRQELQLLKKELQNQKINIELPNGINSVNTNSAAEANKSISAQFQSLNQEEEKNRNQSYTKLRESNELLVKTLRENEKIFENSLDVICSLDNNGNFIKVSAACKRVWGYEPQELVGRNCMELVHDDDQFFTIQTAQEITGGMEKRNFENRFVHKNGTIVPMLWSARWEESEQIVYCIAKDISEKKKLQKAVDVERERFLEMFTKAPVIIAVIKGQDLTFKMANSNYLKVIGRTDILGKKIKDVLPELEEQGMLEILNNVYKTGKTFTAKEWLVKLDRYSNGNLVDFYANFVFQPYRDKVGDAEDIFVFAIDVSEQVISRKKLEASEVKYRSFFEHSPDGILLSRLNGKIFQANPAACEIFQMDEKEICNKGYGLIDTTDPNFQRLIEEREKTGKTKGELTLIRKDGFKFPGEITSVLFKDSMGEDKSCVMIRDITVRKLAEDKIYQSELSLKEAQKISEIGNYSWDLLEDKITLSEEIRRILGYENLDKSPILDNFLKIVHPEDKEYIVESYRKSILENKPFDIVYRIITEQGVLKYVHARNESIYNEKGEAIFFVGTIQDITNRKLTELERDKTNKELLQRNKDLEQFAYIVSHNLRSPVANILGCMEILFDPVFDEATKKEILDGLLTSTKKLDAVVWDLNYILQIKREINEKKELIKLSELVEDTKISIENLIKKEKVEILANFQEQDEIFSLRTYLYSIFYNLITNSIKYKQEEGIPVIEIYSKRKNKKLEIVFKDNGRGIDLTRKGDQVFGLYKRFHLDIEGKGMGLFMVKSQVETLGGSITIQSEVNKGTIFTIIFDID